MIEFLLTNGIKLDLEKLLHKFKNLPGKSSQFLRQINFYEQFECRYWMKLLIWFAGLSGVWSDNTNDLTICSVPCLYFLKCSEAICFS